MGTASRSALPLPNQWADGQTVDEGRRADRCCGAKLSCKEGSFSSDKGSALGPEICTDPSHSGEGRGRRRGGEGGFRLLPGLLPRTGCSRARTDPREGCRWQGGGTAPISVHLDPLPWARSLAPTWAAVAKHTAAAAPLSALPPPPVPAPGWLPPPPQRRLPPPEPAAEEPPPPACKPQDQPSGKPRSAWSRLITAGPLTFSGSSPRTSRRPQPGRRASARPPARPRAVPGARCPVPAPHLPAAAAAPPARAHEVIPPGRIAAFRARRGGRGTAPAAGRGAWDPRPTPATPPGVRVVSHLNACAGGAPRDRGPREKSRRDLPCTAPSPSAPPPLGRLGQLRASAGLPRPARAPAGIVPFAEWETGLSFQLNAPRTRNVYVGHPFLEAPGGAPHPPRRERTADSLPVVKAGTSAPLATSRKGNSRRSAEASGRRKRRGVTPG